MLLWPTPTRPHEDEDETNLLAAEKENGEAEEQEDIAPIPRLQNTRTIEIERFVPGGQVDARYFDKPYYIAPRGEISQEVFAVIRDAMARENVAGLARILLSSRERPFLVEPTGQGLRGVTLRFAQEVRDVPSFRPRVVCAKCCSRGTRSTFGPAGKSSRHTNA
jgi:DNA end-binding protein Ku